MKFESHEERMQHPQARLIPQSLWRDDSYREKILENMLLITEYEDGSIIDKLTEAGKLLGDDKNKQAMWLAIALSRPNLKENELLRIAYDELGMSYKLIFAAAVHIGDLNIMKRMVYMVKRVESAPDCVHNMIKADNYDAFTSAAANGELTVMNCLVELAPDDVQDMIKADDYYVFTNAAANDNLPVMQYLASLKPNDVVQGMIKNYCYSAFTSAAANGDLTIMKRLVEVVKEMESAPDDVQDMIKADDYSAFTSAAANGHSNIMEYLESLAPNTVQDMIKANNYSAFTSAAANDHLDVIKYLASLKPNGVVQGMIKDYCYSAFARAAANGDLTTMKRLVEVVKEMESAPDDVQDMIKADDYSAFTRAAENGHLPVMKYLVKLAPDNVLDMIKANNGDAAENHYQNTVNRLLRELIKELIAGIPPDSHFKQYVEKILKLTEELAPSIYRSDLIKTLAVTYDVIAYSQTENINPEILAQKGQACAAQGTEIVASLQAKTSKGKKLGGLLLGIAGVALIAASIAFAVVTHFLATPIAIAGISLGASYVSASIGGVGLAAGLAGAGLFATRKPKAIQLQETLDKVRQETEETQETQKQNPRG